MLHQKRGKPDGAPRPVFDFEDFGNAPILFVRVAGFLVECVAGFVGIRTVFVVMGVEQAQLLAAMDRIERVVDVESDPFGNPGERLAIKSNHRAITHPLAKERNL